MDEANAPALEHVPFRWNHLDDKDMLQLVDVERFLIDHMFPCDRKALQEMKSMLFGNGRCDAWTLTVLMCMVVAASFFAPSPHAQDAILPQHVEQEAGRDVRGVVFSGQIFDASKTPLAKVRVGLRGLKAFAETGPDGRFFLAADAAALAKRRRDQPAGYLEFDKEGYVGQSLAIADLDAATRPITQTLPPVVATEDRAEFTARVTMSRILPAIGEPKAGALIDAARWRAYFAGLDARLDAGVTEQALFQSYVPKSAAKLNAVFLMTRHGIGSIDHPRLRAFADRNGVALVAVKGDPLQRGFYPVSILDVYLDRLGRMTSRPEMASSPLITFGHSNGTGFSGIYASQRPERVIAWISYHPGSTSYLQFPNVEKTPGLVMHGLIDPFFTPAFEKTIELMRRERHAAIALMLEPDVPHFPIEKDQNATWEFIVAFCEAALRVRLNADGSLKAVALESGWLGANYDREKGGRQQLEIAPYHAFVGDRAKASWLPDQFFAEAWRRYENTPLR